MGRIKLYDIDSTLRQTCQRSLVDIKKDLVDIVYDHAERAGASCYKFFNEKDQAKTKLIYVNDFREFFVYHARMDRISDNEFNFLCK